MSAAELSQELSLALAELGFAARPDQVAALLELAHLVESWGQRMNLSGHRTADAVVRRLILDAAALLTVAPPFASLADLGSGAGFPGLPIAILRPDVQVTLVDSRERRHHFQRAACRQLDLENVHPLRGRLETLIPTPHEAVLAQALAHPEEALPLMKPWGAPSAHLLIPTTENGPLPAADESLSATEIRPYQAPGGPRHRLWIAKLP
jgi:16S rRNA (guanine527-N7)-methyltransferase